MSSTRAGSRPEASAAATAIEKTTNSTPVAGDAITYAYRCILRDEAEVMVTGGSEAAITYMGLGGFIFYNTNVLNTYKPRSISQFESAEYERNYKHLEDVPQPRVTDIKVAIDLAPGRRSASSAPSSP